MAGFVLDGFARFRGQPPWIEEVLRLELLPRPRIPWLEFDAEEIADLPVHTVFHVPNQMALRVADPDHRPQRNGLIQLQARPRKRNVFKVCNRSLRAAILLTPLEVDEIRAEQSRL